MDEKQIFLISHTALVFQSIIHAMITGVDSATAVSHSTTEAIAVELLHLRLR